MKTKFILGILLLFLSLSYAQQGINYKAIIKDANGNLVANTNVPVRFTILQGAPQTIVYEESQMTLTDANGLMILNIGKGTPTIGIFNAINWAAGATFLNTRINIGSGMVNMGTTEFNAVPYALNATGLQAIDEGKGIGWRLAGRDSRNYGAIGLSAVDLSYNHDSSEPRGATGAYAVAMGMLNRASGSYSLAMGSLTNASGTRSTAMGGWTLASGENSTAMGDGGTASGHTSTAMGVNTIASANFSTAMGISTIAASYSSTAIGRSNIGGGSPTTWVGTEPLFEVGNGEANRSNAFTILKNGKIGIGTHKPNALLHLTDGNEATLANGTGHLIIGKENGQNVVYDNNEIQSRNNGNHATLYLQHRGGNVYVGGIIVHSSDSRFKKDITALPYGLETILKLNPVIYNWKNREQDHKSLGLIAQEVQPIIKEIVHVSDDKDKTLSVSYTELIPVLIKAIKEQQAIIDNQQKQIDQLKTLETKLDQLEALLITPNQ